KLISPPKVLEIKKLNRLRSEISFFFAKKALLAWADVASEISLFNLIFKNRTLLASRNRRTKIVCSKSPSKLSESSKFIIIWIQKTVSSDNFILLIKSFKAFKDPFDELKSINSSLLTSEKSVFLSASTD